MMDVKKHLHVFFRWAAPGALALASAACAVAGPEVVATVTFKSDGTVEAVDKSGKEFVECAVCPPEYAHKYGHKCERLEDQPDLLKRVLGGRPLCGSLTDTNVNRIVNVVQSGRNPDCITIMIFGKLFKVNPECAH